MVEAAASISNMPTVDYNIPFSALTGLELTPRDICSQRSAGTEEAKHFRFEIREAVLVKYGNLNSFKQGGRISLAHE